MVWGPHHFAADRPNKRGAHPPNNPPPLGLSSKLANGARHTHIHSEQNARPREAVESASFVEPSTATVPGCDRSP